MPAPETYADFTFESNGPKLEGDTLKDVAGFAKELGLDQVGAQKYVTREAARVAAAPKQTVGAPQKYADFKLPDGVKLEADRLTQLHTTARELGLSQEAAQKFVDREVALEKDAADAQGAEATRLTTEWKAALAADKEIGGEKLNATLALGKRVLSTFTRDAKSDKLEKLLNDGAMGSHPEVVRFLSWIGAALSEDKLVPAQGAPPAVSRFYANSNMAVS